MKFAESLESGLHASLVELVGEWTGTCRTWFEPDVLADESAMHGSFRAVLGGRFLIYEYAGELQGTAFEGMAIIGFDLAERKWQSAWIDSFHMSTAIMLSEGRGSAEPSVTGDYYAGEGEPRWGWRTEIVQNDDDNVIVTAFNITPSGEAAKATETHYIRKV